MKHSIAATVAILVLALTAGSNAQRAGAPGLVGTWILTSAQETIGNAPPAPMRGARGLLIFDGAGHTLELLSRDEPEVPQLTEAQARFYAVGGSWGGYEADLGAGRITYRPRGARSPNVMGTEFDRHLELDGDRLTVTSLPGELHTLGTTEWRWERLPPLSHLTDEFLAVVGFWEHIVEGRQNATTGDVMTETRRAPSVIVYTPSGFVGVHFPTRDRPRFAAGEPSDEEARQARGYLGYFAALGAYPGMVYHHILAGGLTPGSSLRRFYEIDGTDLNLTFPPNRGRDGQLSQTYVKLRRLSNADDMLGR